MSATISYGRLVFGCTGLLDCHSQNRLAEPEPHRELGLELSPAVNAVEAGITEVWNLLVSGRLKVMESLVNCLREFRKYHRDDKGSGKVVKRDDHLMDATRYLVVSGRSRMMTEPRRPVVHPRPPRNYGPDEWMG